MQIEHRMTFSRRAVAATALAMLSSFSFAACSGATTSTIQPTDGGATDASDSATPRVPPKCDTLAKALCTRIEACAPQLFAVGWGSRATCEARLTPDCNKGLAANGNVATEADITGCAATLAGTTCAELFDGKLGSLCGLPGTLANGAACSDNGQCQERRCKKSAKGDNCGTCDKPLPAGSDCVEDQDCEGALKCNANKKCALVAKLGESCENSACAFGTKCNAGKCVAALGAGAACVRVGDQDACDLTGAGLICIAGKCTALVVSQQDGPCGLVGTTGGVCAGYGKCSAEIPKQGTCGAPRDVGQPCNDTDKCLEPAKCTGGVCALGDPSACK